MNESEVVIFTYDRVVLTKRGSDMNYTGTVREGYVVIARYEISFALGLNEVEERLVFGVFQLFSDIAFKKCILVLDNR